MILGASTDRDTSGLATSVILLNGASSAGKSTLGRALHAQLEEPFLRFSLDLFLFGGEVLPPVLDRSRWAAMRPMLFEGYYGCLAALAGAGNNLIVDHVVETEAQLDRLVDVLSPFDVFYVGVHCPLPELERRERERGDRRPGDARRDQETVHSFCPYDAEVDGMLAPKENAASLIARWKAHRHPGVLNAWRTRRP